MNNATNPWKASSEELRSFSFCEAGARFPETLRRAMACASLHLRRIGNWWSARLRSLWQQGDVGSRMAALGLFIAGLATILFMTYLLVCLIPFMLLAVFIGFVCSAVMANQRMARSR